MTQKEQRDNECTKFEHKETLDFLAKCPATACFATHENFQENWSQMLWLIPVDIYVKKIFFFFLPYWKLQILIAWLLIYLCSFQTL